MFFRFADAISVHSFLYQLLIIIFCSLVLCQHQIHLFVTNKADLMLNRMGIRIRNSLVSVIFRKSLRLSPLARQANSGTINNIFANDTKQMADSVTAFPILFAPMQVGFGLYLIYQQVGTAAFAGFGYIVAVMPFLIFCGAMFGILIKRKLKHSDERVKLTNEVFSGIRVLKYYAWEQPFASKLEGTVWDIVYICYYIFIALSCCLSFLLSSIHIFEAFRAKELTEIARIYYNFVCLTLIIDSLPSVQPLLIYFTYTRLGNQLTYTTAFTTLTLFLSIQGTIHYQLHQIKKLPTLMIMAINTVSSH